MRRMHHRRYQGRFTCLASLARSLTAPAATGLLLALAVLLAIMPMRAPAQGNAQAATYRVTFEGKFTASALASGVSVPSGAHFTTLIGAVHNGSVTFWSSGGTASAGVEAVAELGTTGAFKSEINAAMLNALAVIEQSIASGPTATATLDITLTTDHPRVTLLTMIAPSPDWFVGVSGLSLRNTADDGWQPSLTVNLFPYDAGTEEGTEFSLNNSATSPQGTITSIKGMGKFSNEPIATLTFDLLAAPVITTTSPIFVPENDTAVATLTATDNDTPIDQLIWTIPSSTDGGSDADHFTLTAAGVLAFSAAKDYENPDDADGDGNYEVTVQVSDGDNPVTADLLVTLENVLELLSELSGPSSRNFAENGALRVATYTASSPEDNGDVTWLLSGTDSGDFSIDGGVLRFALEPASPSHKFPSLPDFESASDADTNNVYSITVIASDGSTTLTKNATVTVSDENEAGVVTISPVRPRVGTALTATLTDPDGSTSGVAWTWQRSAGPTTWAAIDGANSSSYTPVAADAGHYLRATATYSDDHGAGQTAQAVAPYTPLAHQLSALSVAGPARGPYPAFDPDVLHYAMECAAGQTITLTLSAAESSTRVAVNGVQRRGQNAVVELTGLDGYSDIPITLSGGQGGATTYVLHCFQEDFPDISTEQRPGATEELIGFSLHTRPPGLGTYGFLVIVDNNGVPRVHRRIGARANAFRPQNSETYPFSYSVPDAQTRDVWILVDRELNELGRVATVPPLLATDKHDFVILDNGDYLLLSYEPVLRDFSHLIDSDGNPLPPNPDRSDGRYPVEDTAIQIRTPAGVAKLTWYSWDHMVAQECGGNPFPSGDWAHGNSLWMADGVIVASFRACGKVLAIDAATGDVVWRLGRSYRAPEEWGSDELSGHGRGTGPAPMTILNDAYGEFCGQHSAQVLDNGHLLLYDNGHPCVRDPATGVSQRDTGMFSRAVEYAIDPGNGEAIFQRHHSLHGDFNRGARAAGLVEPMDNGDWLVSWGFSDGERITAVPVDESVTQVDPDTGTEKFSINVQIDHRGDESIQVRAYPLSPTALATEPVALTAEIAVSASNSAVHTGPLDKPQVVVAFNQPVVDFTAATASVSVQGATIESVSPHIVAGEPANAYLFTLTPTGVGPITFALAAGQSCASSGICTASGSLLSEVPASSHVIPPRPTGPSVTSITSSATHPARDGFTVTITFSEAVTGLEASEITVTHGTGSNFAGAAALYTLDITPNAGIEDDVTVTVMAGAVVDGVNKGNLEASAVFSVDTQAPVVSTVAITSIPGPDATYTPGEVIEATVTFSETVVVTGTPQLTLNVGGGDRTANYQSGVDAALLFSYTVVEGDTDGVSIEADSLSLNGGTIRDGADNAAVLDHGAVTAQAGHKVDGVRPELAAAGGAVIDATTLTLTYDEPLDAGSDAEPGDFTVAGGDRARTVTRVVIRGASVELTLDVGAEHGEAGILVSYTSGMNPIRDVAGNAAEALSRVPVTNETPDTTAPAVSSLAINSNPGTDGTYAIGDGIEVTVRFDETVEVAGPPQLRLKVGSRSRTASYLRGTGHGRTGVRLRGGPGGRRHRRGERGGRPDRLERGDAHRRGGQSRGAGP